jgi:hydroxymethylglutaryl-CoA synthase
MPLSSYARYLSYRGLLILNPVSRSGSSRQRPPAGGSATGLYACTAASAMNCGTVTFPIERICYNCRSKDNFEEVRLSDKKARVFTYTLDSLAGRSDDPTVPQIGVEFDVEQCQSYLLMTDCDPGEVRWTCQLR